MESRLITLPNSGDSANKKKPRVLALGGELLEILERREKDRRPDCPLVFHRSGKPVKSFRKAWDSACKEAGRPDLVPHDMRRSAVRNFRKAGIPETVGMALSGHRTNSVFKRYDIIDTEDVQAAVAKVQDYLKQQKETAQAKVVPLRAAQG
jgi:integrase